MAAVRSRYRTLPLYASPLEEESSEHHHGHEHHLHGHDLQSAPEYPTQKESSTVEEHQVRPALGRALTFREREEASSIELFYDLFFVANLSSFTSTHNIDDARGDLIVQTDTPRY